MWKAELSDTPFITSNGTELPSTAKVSYLSEQGEVLSTKLYGFGDEKWLFENFSKGNFSLSEIYFKNFSVKDFINTNLETKSITDFIAESCFFDGETDLSDTFFLGKKFSMAQSVFANGNVSFRGSVLEVNVADMNNITFDKGTLDFHIVRVPNARISFSGSKFGSGEINFDFSIFSKEGLDFSGAQFGDIEMTFRNTTFNNGNILFFGTEFGNGIISFGGAKMGNANLDFSFSQYKNCEIRFRHTVFGFGKLNFNGLSNKSGKLFFEVCEFRGKNMSFANSELGEINFNRCTFSEHVDMSVNSCKALTLNNCIIEKSFDMSASHRRKVEIGTFNISHTKNLGQIDIDWRYNKVHSMIFAQGDTTTYHDKANQFRLLKENFRNLGRYSDEDEAYVAFKRCESWSGIRDKFDENFEKSKFSRFLNRLAYPFKWFVLDYIGRYATNPFRILGAMFLSIFVFTILYSMPFVILQGEKELFLLTNNKWIHDIVKALYHSIATNFTIGYGDVNPGNFIAMILSGIQGFFGLFLMSYFTVAFVRKILR